MAMSNQVLAYSESRPHRKLLAWQEAIRLTSLVYDITRGFPSSEMHALTSQMRRAAISVASNIAEGAARGSKREFTHFLGLARGSLSELDTQFLIAHQLGYISSLDAADEVINRTFKLLNGLISKTRADSRQLTNH